MGVSTLWAGSTNRQNTGTVYFVCKCLVRTLILAHLMCKLQLFSVVINIMQQKLFIEPKRSTHEAHTRRDRCPPLRETTVMLTDFGKPECTLVSVIGNGNVTLLNVSVPDSHMSHLFYFEQKERKGKKFCIYIHIYTIYIYIYLLNLNYSEHRCRSTCQWISTEKQFSSFWSSMSVASNSNTLSSD